MIDWQLNVAPVFELNDYYYHIPENAFACKLKDYKINFDGIQADDLVKTQEIKDEISDRLYNHTVNENKKIYAKFFAVRNFLKTQ